MPQKLVQQQRLTQEQLQLQSAMQVLASKLTELPLDGLRERVENELAENPYLEASASGEADASLSYPGEGGTDAVAYDARRDYASEDDVPDYLLRSTQGSGDSEAENMGVESAESTSFYDYLMQQAGEYDLPPHDRQVLEYLIGSLGDDGLLAKPLYQIADELSIYHYLDTTPEEVERILGILWTFDPAGVGARSLQECLVLQCRRKQQHIAPILQTIIEQQWDEITRNRWDIIQRKHDLTDAQVQQLRHDLRRLNPRPGSAMGEQESSAENQITPDVVISVDQDARIEVMLNEGDMPMLTVSEDAMEMIDEAFVRDYVNRGRLFIGAILQRRQTILNTVQAIVKLQRKYLLSGDETLLSPMRLEDVATLTHQDLSTISRVCNSKYAETPYGTHPLRWFFSRAVKTEGEGDASVRQIHSALQALVQGENKKIPLSDDALTELLRGQGFDVARRTVAKYREQLGIPTSRMRRE